MTESHKIFQISRSHSKIMGARTVTRSKFHTHNPLYKTYLPRRPGASVLCTSRLRKAATARVGILCPPDSWVVTSVLDYVMP